MNSIKKMLLILVTLACAVPLGALPIRSLKNVGNSCFINATIQCLSHIDSMALSILFEKDDYYKKKSLAARYRKLLKELNSEQASDNKVKKQLKKFCSQSWETLGVRKYSQQDAAELIDTLFNHITDYDIQDTVKDTLPFYPGTYQPQTMLSNLFFSCVHSILTPLGLFALPSVKTEPVSMLTIPFTPKALTLEDCLSAYFMPTKLTGNEKITYLPGIRVDALKRLALKHTSEYLIIRLNRNKFTVEHDRKNNKVFVSTKLSEPVSFPLTHLDVSPYFDLGCKQEGYKYNLISFIVHVGSSASSGHYTAYVKNEDGWHYCDDRSIIKITNKQIEDIAKRGYAIDPLHLLFPESQPQENIKTSKRQTPVLFFYEKEPRATDESKVPEIASHEEVLKIAKDKENSPSIIQETEKKVSTEIQRNTRDVDLFTSDEDCIILN